MAPERPRLVRPGDRLLLAALFASGACATGGPHSAAAVVPWHGDGVSAVSALLAAAPACGLKAVDGRRDEAGTSAVLVFLESAQGPGPESAVVTVRVAAGGDGISLEIEAHPLAEYGMAPPDIRAGSVGFVCAPCAEARTEIATVRYSRGLAVGNAARAVRCLREGLEAAGPPG